MMFITEEELTTEINERINLKEKKIFPLGNTNKVLIEFSFTNEIKNIEDIIYEFKIEGYEVIIAHVERYNYANYKLIKSWKEKGALIQVNASSFYETQKQKSEKKEEFKTLDSTNTVRMYSCGPTVYDYFHCKNL